MHLRSQFILASIFALALLQFFVCETLHTYNFYNINHIAYRHFGKEEYSWGELLCNTDNYFLMFVGLWAIRKLTKGITWAKYFVFLLRAWLCVGLYYSIFKNPYIENIGEDRLVLASLCIFIALIVLYHLGQLIKR